MVNRERLWSGIAAFVFSLGGLSSNAGADGALVAADTSNGPILIVTTNRDTRQQATEAALAACRERAGSACRLFYNFDDMCITYTTSQSSFWHALHKPPKRNSDADNAVELCNKRRQSAAHSCAPAITACDTPYYQHCLQKADLKACRAAAAVFLQDPNRKEIEAQIDRLERMKPKAKLKQLLRK